MGLSVKNWVFGSALFAAIVCLLFLGIWFIPDAIKIGIVWLVAIFITLLAAYIAVLGVLEAYRFWQASEKKHRNPRSA